MAEVTPQRVVRAITLAEWTVLSVNLLSYSAMTYCWSS